MDRNAKSFLTMLSFCAAVAACAQPQDPAPGIVLTRTCIGSIAAAALANRRTNEFAANIAGPLGLTPTSDPDAPAWQTRQVQFPTTDGTVHYFAVENASWTKAAIIRTAATRSGGRLRMFVMDRHGTLLAAGLIENRRLDVLDIRNRDVRIQYLIEQALWRLAGADDACGAS